MQIHVDSNTSALELHHLSVLFQALSKAYGYEAQTVSVSDIVKVTVGEPVVTVSLEDVAPTAEETAAAYDFFNHPINTDHASVDDAGNVTVSVTPPVVTDTNLDSSGLPWDARIHAGSRERNTDGSWRVRRRPKGVEEAEWDATLARVTSELRDLMEIPVSTGAALDAVAETAESGPFYWVHPESSCCGKADTREELNEVLGDGLVEEIDAEQYDKFVADGYIAAGLPVTAPSLTSAEVDQFVEIMGGITDDTPAPIAPPVILPPVVLPPVTAVAPPIKPAIETFAQLMSWLTSRTPKDEAAKPAMVQRVNEILAANGLTTLQQLGQRSDLIPQVLAQFVEAFGE